MPLSARLLELARQFPENGLKLLLHNPANVRDVLSMAGVRFLDRIDFDRLKVDPTTFISSDYRHVSSDLVLQAPLRLPGSSRRRTVTLYILFEHQSEPEWLILLRVMDYLGQIWKAQVRTWLDRHPSTAGLRLQPILPVVLYTGLRPWPGLGRLWQCVEQGEQFQSLIPDYEPLFINLPALSPEMLERAGGWFGWVLRLLQQRRAGSAEFAALVQRAVQHLEGMAEVERTRWLELLSYLNALSYHERSETEADALRETITDSVRTDPVRQELNAMWQTAAEAMHEKGRTVGRTEGLLEGAVLNMQQVLLRVLRQRFQRIPKATEKVVLATKDMERLEAWFERALTAVSLGEVGIHAPK